MRQMIETIVIGAGPNAVLYMLEARAHELRENGRTCGENLAKSLSAARALATMALRVLSLAQEAENRKLT